MKYILIAGAKSDIAKSIAKEYAENGYNLYLAARNCNDLTKFSNNFQIRYKIEIQCIELDILNFKSHNDFYENLNPKPDGVICAIGYLGKQEKSQNNFEEAKLIIDTNYTGCVSLLNIIANDFEQRKTGFIVGISSVAGDRGRKNNYLYASAKSAFTTYLSGLRNRLNDSGIQVLNVKPGFVNTKMTENMKLTPKLTSKPEEVAKDIFFAQKKGKDTLYTKWIWKWIMLVIKAIPEKIFKKMNI